MGVDAVLMKDGKEVAFLGRLHSLLSHLAMNLKLIMISWCVSPMP